MVIPIGALAQEGRGNRLDSFQNLITGHAQIDLSPGVPIGDDNTALTERRTLNVDASAHSLVDRGDWTETATNTSRTGTIYPHTGLNAVPGVPTNFVAEGGTNYINFSWTAPDDGGKAIEQYMIDVSINEGLIWVTLAVNIGTATNYVLRRGVVPGTTYHFRVRAENEDGSGDPSDVAITTAGTPGVVTNLRAIASGATQVDLSWTAPSNNGGAAITGYRIEVSPDGTDESWSELEDDTESTSASYSHSGLTAGTTRHYRVYAINSRGLGLIASNVARATAGTPGAPANFVAEGGTNYINLSWTAPANDGGKAIKRYTFDLSINAGQTWVNLGVDPGIATTYVLRRGVVPGKTYHFRVRAENDIGFGAPSHVASTTAGTPGVVTGLRAMASGATQIDLSWTAPSINVGAVITGYRIEVSPDGTDGNWSELEDDTKSTSTSYSHSGLTTETTRHYRVYAINSRGLGLIASNVARATARTVTDVTIPTVGITGVPASIKSEIAFTATFTFSEDVTGFVTGDVTVTGGTKGNFSGSGSRYSLVVTPAGGSNVTVTVSANAATDGTNTGPSSDVSETAVWINPITVSITMPQKINSRNSLTVNITFSEWVRQFQITDVTVTGGAKGNLSGNGSNYSLVVIPTGSADVTVTVKAGSVIPRRGNAGPESSVSATTIWDSSPPTVMITGVPNRINSSTIFAATFTFSEDVTGFAAGDVTVSGGTKSAFNGNGSVYTMDVTPTESENVVVTVNQDAATDGLNTGPASTVSATAIWDATVPAVAIAGVPTRINSAATFTATFTFSETVTGFVEEDVTVSGGTKGNFSGSGSSYSLVVTPTGGSDVTVTIEANAATGTDGSTTGPASAVSVTAIWDAAPTVEIAGVPHRINTMTNFTATFTFSESVTGFVIGDVTVTGGTKGNFSGNGNNYSLVVIPAGSADVVVTVNQDAATDGLNTGPAAAVSATAIWDSSPPTVAITGVPDKINTRTTFAATFTFSEEVTGFAAGDVTVSGGAKGAFNGNGSVYTMDVTPAGSADVAVTVNQDAATDGLNTGPAAAVSATAIWDSSPPTVAITGVPDKINTRTTFAATFTFSEEVTGFAAGDVTVSGGTKSAFNGNGSVYTMDVTPTGSENVVVTVNQDAATDDLNTGPAAAVSTTATWDATLPTVTITGVPGRINTTTNFTVIFIFSEPVTEFVTGDVTVNGGMKGNFTGSGNIYNLVVTPTSGAMVTVTVKANAATDGLNTGPAAAVSATAIWDAKALTVEISGMPSRINSAAPLTTTFLFSKAVTEFVIGDVTVTGGAKGNFSGSGDTYNLVINPAAGSNLTVEVRPNSATDGITTGPTSAVSSTAIWDAATPTVAITGVPDKINSTAIFTAVFTFSETVTGFGAGDVTVIGGTKGNFSGIGDTYTLEVVPAGGSDVTVTVDANSVTDGLNSGPVSAVSATAIWDVVSAKVVVGDAAATEGNALTFTVELDEAVPGGLTVTPNFTDGTATKGVDYTENTAALAFDGTSGETQAFSVTTIEDAMVEGDETFTVSLTVSGTTASVTVTGTGTGTIMDDDMPVLPEVAFNVTSASIGEDIGTHSVTVNARPAPAAEFTLNYSLEGSTATEGTDYSIVNSGSVSMTAGVESVDIPVMVVDDNEDEREETVILTLTGGAGYTVGNAKVYMLTITDNETTVTLAVSPNPVSEGEEVTVMATLSEAASSEVTIPLVFTAGTAEENDYSALSSIVINKDELSGSGGITTLNDDDLDDEMFTIALGTLPDGILTGAQESIEITITDAGEITAIESMEEDAPPIDFALEQNYPNPFNPSTAIEFSLTRTGQVTLTVYDLLGQKVQTLIDGMQPAGRHNVLFNGAGLASDTYIYVLQTEEYRAVKMMTLLK